MMGLAAWDCCLVLVGLVLIYGRITFNRRAVIRLSQIARTSSDKRQNIVEPTSATSDYHRNIEGF